MFGSMAAYEKEFFDLWETQVFELAAMNYDKTKIAETAVNRVSTDMMQRHGLSTPEMLRIIENAMRNR